MGFSPCANTGGEVTVMVARAFDTCEMAVE